MSDRRKRWTKSAARIAVAVCAVLAVTAYLLRQPVWSRRPASAAMVARSASKPTCDF